MLKKYILQYAVQAIFTRPQIYHHHNQYLNSNAAIFNRRTEYTFKLFLFFCSLFCYRYRSGCLTLLHVTTHMTLSRISHDHVRALFCRGTRPEFLNSPPVAVK